MLIAASAMLAYDIKKVYLDLIPT